MSNVQLPEITNRQHLELVPRQLPATAQPLTNFEIMNSFSNRDILTTIYTEPNIDLLNQHVHGLFLILQARFPTQQELDALDIEEDLKPYRKTDKFIEELKKMVEYILKSDNLLLKRYIITLGLNVEENMQNFLFDPAMHNAPIPPAMKNNIVCVLQKESDEFLKYIINIEQYVTRVGAKIYTLY
jgi:hypothetical protein